jgi:hypothetical protein
MVDDGEIITTGFVAERAGQVVFADAAWSVLSWLTGGNAP